MEFTACGRVGAFIQRKNAAVEKPGVGQERGHSMLFCCYSAAGLSCSIVNRAAPFRKPQKFARMDGARRGAKTRLRFAAPMPQTLQRRAGQPRWQSHACPAKQFPAGRGLPVLTLVQPPSQARATSD